MQSPARHAAPLILALLLASQAVLAATPPVGINVSAQLWDPLQPEADTPKALYDAPAGISAPMNTAWNSARRAMMDVVPKALAELDIGAGFRLYGVQFNVNELGPISLAQVTPVQQGDAAPLRLHWTIPATHLALKVRTPGPAPQGTDPGFSASVDLDLAVALAVSDTPGKTLQVTEVRIAVPKDGVHFQGDNPTGDVLVSLTSLLSEVATGKNLNTLLNLILDDQNFADGNRNSLALFSPALRRIDVAALANAELATVNQAIRVPAGYAHIGQWLKRSGQGQELSLLFAPRNLPLPPQSGVLSGWVAFGAQAPLPAGCEPAMFSTVDVQVQTGPRPVLDAAPWRYGNAPTRTLGGVTLGTGALDAKNRRCAYKLSSLVAAWPNRIEFHKRAAQGSSHYVPNPKQYWALAPQGWSSPQVPTGSERDLAAAPDTVSSVTVGALREQGAAPAQPANPGDPAAVWNAKSQLGKTQAAQQSAQQAEKTKQISWGARTGP